MNFFLTQCGIRTLRFPFAMAVAICAVAVLFNGCSGSAAAPVRVDRAQETLRLTLENWQSGQSLEDFEKGSQKVIVQDFDWKSGTKLQAFEVLPDARPVGANMIAKVKLTLSDPSGAQVEKIVTYVVGTSPKLTVFRDLLN